jgi:hypothetical protein
MHDFYHDRARLHPRKRYYIETSDGRVADFTLTQDSYHYSKLPDALREKIDNSMIHLISVTRATRAQLTDLFLRVNSGAPLNGQEKRNAIISLVAENVRSISSKYEDSIASCFMAHKSIIRLGFHESIASWLCMYTHASRPVTINNSVLDRAYATNSAEEQNLVSFLSLANNTLEGVSKHASLFRSAKFKKFNLHNLFLLVNHLDANRYQIKDYSKFLSWFVTTEMARVRSTEHVYTTIHATSKQYSELTTDDASTFSTRLRTMLSDFNQSTLEEDSVIVSLDPNRIATPKQRYDLWVKQNHHCTLSKKFIPLREIYDASKWQADHYPIRHTDGGPTTVENMRLISKEEHSKVTAAQNSRKSA